VKGVRVLKRTGSPQILVSGLYSHKIQWMVRELRSWVGGRGRPRQSGTDATDSEAAKTAVNMFAAVALQSHCGGLFAGFTSSRAFPCSKNVAASPCNP
jgi:hypothetical protein